MINKFIDFLLRIKVFNVFSVIILLLKIVYSIIAKFDTNYFEDWRIANNIAKYGIYAEFLEVGSTAYKLPVYPIFLSLFVFLFPNFPEAAVIIAQHLILFIVPILIIRILAFFKKEKAGILSAYLFIFSPAYFYYSNVIEITNVFVPIFLGWIYLYVNIFLKNKNTLSYYSVFGGFTGVLCLTQVVVVPMVILLILALFIFRKIRFYSVVIILFFSGLVYSPWVIRNQLVFDKVVLTKSPFWQNIYLSFTPEPNIWDDVKLISAKHEKYTFRLRSKVDEFEMEKIYKEETLKVLEGNLHLYYKKAVQNAFLLWYVPSRYVYDNSISVIVGRKAFAIILNIFTLWALFWYFKKNRLLFYFSLLLFANFTFPYLIGHASNTRFKLDFEWYQYVLVSLFLYEKWLGRKAITPKKSAV